MKKLFIVQLIFILIAGMSCKVNNSSSGTVRENSNTSSSSTVQANNSSLTLFQYLKQVPGLQVSGSESNPQIYIRQAFSFNADNHPLFVINGQRVGKIYASVASMVSVSDIKSVTVLKDVASTSAYGLEGANGVILIRTKRGYDK